VTSTRLGRASPPGGHFALIYAVSGYDCRSCLYAVSVWLLVFRRSSPYVRLDSPSALFGPVHLNVAPGAGAKSASIFIFYSPKR